MSLGAPETQHRCLNSKRGARQCEVREKGVEKKKGEKSQATLIHGASRVTLEGRLQFTTASKFVFMVQI